MKLTKTLDNQKGSALFEILAAMAILTFVVTGMMITITYARYKALTNYHDRKVAFLVDGELNRIRLHFMKFNALPSLIPQTIAIEEPYRGKRINCRITFSKFYQYDYNTGLNVVYTSVTAVGEWRENPDLFGLTPTSGQVRHITLREDYYQKVTP